MKKEILEAYWQGTLPRSERKEVELYLQVQEESDATFDDLFKQLWNTPNQEASQEVFSEILFSEIESVLDQKKEQPVRKRSFLKYAAAITLLAFSSWFVITNQSQAPVENEVAVVKWVTKKTTKGQKSTIMLNDGSKVVLNAESSLKYRKNFTDSSRIIELTGEAFFEVAKDKTRPFSVITNGISTTALGTSFNINGKNEEIKVSLATGKVVVNSNAGVSSEKYFLSPGDAILFKESEVIQTTFNAKKDLYWKDGILYFENEKFGAIVETLESWYNVKVTIQHPPKKFKTYTGQFNNEPLSNVLENMGFSLDFEYFLNGKKATLIFN